MALPNDLSKLLGEGENPDGFFAAAPPGTFHDNKGPHEYIGPYGPRASGKWNDAEWPEWGTGFSDPSAMPVAVAMVASRKRKR